MASSAHPLVGSANTRGQDHWLSCYCSELIERASQPSAETCLPSRLSTVCRIDGYVAVWPLVRKGLAAQAFPPEAWSVQTSTQTAVLTIVHLVVDNTQTSVLTGTPGLHSSNALHGMGMDISAQLNPAPLTCSGVNTGGWMDSGVKRHEC